jgi:hypothetical protein
LTVDSSACVLTSNRYFCCSLALAQEGALAVGRAALEHSSDFHTVAAAAAAAAAAPSPVQRAPVATVTPTAAAAAAAAVPVALAVSAAASTVVAAAAGAAVVQHMAAEQQQQQHQLPLPEQIPLNDVDASVPYPVHLLSDADRPDSFSFREFMDEINLAEEPADDSTEPIAIASMAS